MPPIPPGEDEKSYMSHKVSLQAEFTKLKARQDPMLINELVETSFAMRRREILSKGHTPGYNMFKTFPFLQEAEYVGS